MPSSCLTIYSTVTWFCNFNKTGLILKCLISVLCVWTFLNKKCKIKKKYTKKYKGKHNKFLGWYTKQSVNCKIFLLSSNSWWHKLTDMLYALLMLISTYCAKLLQLKCLPKELYILKQQINYHVCLVTIL